MAAQLDSRQAAAKRLTGTGRASTPRSAVRGCAALSLFNGTARTAAAAERYPGCEDDMLRQIPCGSEKMQGLGRQSDAGNISTNDAGRDSTEDTLELSCN